MPVHVSGLHELKVRGRYQTEATVSRMLAEAGKILHVLVRVCLLSKTAIGKMVLEQIRQDLSEIKIKKNLPPEQTHLNKISTCD